MTKNDEVKLKKKHFWTSLIVVAILILGYFYAYYLPTSRAWDKVSEFENEITRCSLDISTSANTLDYQQANLQIPSCKSKVNDALFELNSLRNDLPKEEIEVMELAYKTSGYALDMYKNLVDINLNTYSEEQVANKVDVSINLIDEIIKNINKIENFYSDTRYYKESWENNEEITQIKKDLTEARSELQKALDEYNSQPKCQDGYVLGEDNLCHVTCGNSETYCKTGQCFNGQCVTCPSGYYLGIDGRCYSN